MVQLTANSTVFARIAVYGRKAAALVGQTEAEGAWWRSECSTFGPECESELQSARLCSRAGCHSSLAINRAASTLNSVNVNMGAKY